MRALEYPSRMIGIKRVGIQLFQWTKRALIAADKYIAPSGKLANAAALIEEKIVNIQDKPYMMFDLSPDPILILKPAGEIIFMNRAMAKLSGLKKKEWFNKHVTKVGLVNENSIPLAMSRLKSKLNGEILPYPEIGIMTINGERTVEVRAEVIRRAPLSDPDEVLVQFRDVTERKLAEELVKASEQKFREMFMTMREGVALCELIFDKDGKEIVDFIFQDINPSYENQTGIKRDMVLGKKLSETFGINFQEFSSRFNLPVLRKEVVETGRATVTEMYFEPLKKYFEISIVKQAENRFMLVFLDITERKQSQILSEELKNVAIKLSEALDLNNALSIALNSAFAITGMESGGIYLLDLETGDFVLQHHEGLSDGFIKMINRIPSASAQGKLASDGHVFYATQKEVAEDPRLLPLKADGLTNLLVVPIKKGEQVIGCMNISSYSRPEIPEFARDALIAISSQIGGALEIKRLLNELTKARDLADEQIRDMVHDLNNLLGGMIPAVDLAFNNTKDPAAKKYMLMVQKNFDTLKNVVRVLSFISKPLRLSEEPIQVFDAVRDGVAMATDTLRYRTDAKIEIETDLYSKVPPVRLEAGRLELVIFNLIINAFDAIAEKGKVIIKTSRSVIKEPVKTALKDEVMSPGEYVVISVADNGEGIKDLDMLFVRGKSIKDKGSGIGLHLAHTTIKGHNGYILVDTRHGGEDSGTTFSIYLPVGQAL